ncbi:ABC transporter ATP-binding protein [Microbacterium sp. RURRCA19A]|uniref:ABC transporter ATP-binding protein n=1 Tax=Microbacterium sp. RURRCA19A TaxID=1907391 RepID=UPI00095536AC|nr:ABC transporter ATP-binding protein [Microbacterium sp. RURRCA19A]SIR96179.1 ATP-binding cassette, subfamily B [Microbacterium sp. RURRCA19A]
MSPRPSGPRTGGLALIAAYARPHRLGIGIGVLLGLFATGVTLATPLAAKWVLDGLGAGIDLAGPVGALVLLLLVGTCAGFAQTVVLGRLAERIVLDARRSLIQRFFRARLEQIQRFRTGELVTRVTSDTVLLRAAATSSVVQLINGAVALVGTVILMAFLDGVLLLTTLAALVLVGGLFAVFLPRIGRATKRAQDAMGDLGSSLEGGMRALRTIKSSRAEDREIARVTASAEDSARHSIRSVWFSALVWAVAGGGMQLSLVAVLGLGAWRVSSGELAVSSLVAFLLYAVNIIDPITTLAGAFASIQAGLAAAARITETSHLELEDTARRPVAESRRIDRDAPVLSVRAVRAAYGDGSRDVLRDVTIDIPRTGHVALVGPSGAGKTTVFSLLLRFLDPREGHLELDGIPYAHLSIDDVRSRIAYVEQETPVIPGTVRDNVLFRVDDGTDDEAWSALTAVGLDERVRSFPDGLDTAVVETSLSGGERQRLAVSRALVRRPSVLLLDEATAQLDAGAEAAIQEIIAETAATGAVVTIAHRLSTILEADQIVVLDAGSVRDAGTHEELLRRDDLYRGLIQALRIEARAETVDRFDGADAATPVPS